MVVDQPGFIPRMQMVRLVSALRTMRVVVLTGARQTGKTTLAQEIGARQGRRYLTLDRPEILDLSGRDPEALWQGVGRVTLDEVQRSPGLLLHVKRAVDADPRPGRFLLTGSVNLLLMRAVADSLAGRVAYITLPPLTRAEILGRVGGAVLRELMAASSSVEALRKLAQLQRGEAPDPSRAIFDGGFPETLRLGDDDARNVWREGYLASYLQRDLRDLARVADLPDFVRLVRLASLRSGQVLNIDGLARDAGLAPSTARRYLNLLEVSWLVRKLPAHTAGATQRLIKSPKLYLLDSGLACHLAGITSAAGLATSPFLGPLAETFLLQHISSFCELLPGSPRVYYWRTATGRDVDFVVEHGARLLPMELKLSHTLGRNALRGIRAFLDAHQDKAPFGLVLYGGAEVLPLARDVIALPWWMVTDG